MPQPTALVLRALGLGDFVTGLPALRLLRDALPEHRIVLAAPLRYEPLAALAGTVDAITPGHELDPLTEAPRGADLAIDLHGNGLPSVELLRATQPRRIIAYALGDARWRHEEHEVARWCRLLREALILEPGPDPELAGSLRHPAVDAPAGRTVVHCGAAFAARRWPPARFAAVAMLLASEGHQVVITGGPGERDLALQVARAAGVECAVDLSLVELAALLSRARVLISGDTGVAHLAAAYGTASVVLFGPVSPSRWGPPARPWHRALWHGTSEGDPHADSLDPALAAITVSEVVEAVRTLPAVKPTPKPVPVSHPATRPGLQVANPAC